MSAEANDVKPRTSIMDLHNELIVGHSRLPALRRIRCAAALIAKPASRAAAINASSAGWLMVG
jgi:hypothetical protein